MGNEISARFIIEIMGRPSENVSKALGEIVEKMSSDKGVKILDKTLHEPKEIEEAKRELFVAFAEIEASFETLHAFFGVLFAYMPSNVEIFSPEKLKLQADQLNTATNFLLGRLHNYDAVVKKVIGERDILIRQLKDIKSKLSRKSPGMTVTESIEKVGDNKLKKEEPTKKKNSPVKGKVSSERSE